MGNTADLADPGPRPVLKTGLGPILIIMSGHIRAGLKEFEIRASKSELKSDTSLGPYGYTDFY